MNPRFRHVALIGKYRHGANAGSSRVILEEIAHFLAAQGCDVALERDTAQSSGIAHYAALDVEAIGAQCDLALVVGGDGTMLGIGRQLARYGVPLIGINQGRLGFITDIRWSSTAACCHPCCRATTRKTTAA
jgi:NAD+ kinase